MFRPATTTAVFVLSVMLCVACGGDDDDGNSASPSASGDASQTAAPEQESVTTEDAVLSVDLPPGEITPGWPAIVASGDFNADGDTDLVIGAPMADGPDGLRVDAGAAYVLFGPLDGEVASADADLTILGAVAGDNLGSGAAAGDLNADGIDDIIVGASGSNALENLRTDMGEAYVIFGGAELGGTIETLNREQDFTLQPAEGFAQVGRALAAGDVNGDGTDDLVAGAPYGGREPGTEPGGPRTTIGEVYVVFGGPEFGGLVSLAAAGESVRLTGLREFDQFGGSLAVGHITGDSSADIVVGASGYDGANSERDAAGAVFVFPGGPDLTGVISAGEAAISFVAPEAYSFGTLVALADGAGIIATAPSAEGLDARPSAGRVYRLATGTATGAVDIEQCDCAVAISSPASLNLFPASLAASGESVAMGTGLVTDAAGSTYLLDGPTANVDLTAQPQGAILFASSGGDSVAFADLDGDGSPELLTLDANPERPVLYGFRLGD